MYLSLTAQQSSPLSLQSPMKYTKNSNLVKIKKKDLLKKKCRGRKKERKKKCAWAGSRTRIYCLEGSNADRYTTNACTRKGCTTLGFVSWRVWWPRQNNTHQALLQYLLNLPLLHSWSCESPSSLIRYTNNPANFKITWYFTCTSLLG